MSQEDVEFVRNLYAMIDRGDAEAWDLLPRDFCALRPVEAGRAGYGRMVPGQLREWTGQHPIQAWIRLICLICIAMLVFVIVGMLVGPTSTIWS